MKKTTTILSLCVILSACASDPSRLATLEPELVRIGGMVQKGEPKEKVRAELGEPIFEASTEDGSKSCDLFEAGEFQGQPLLHQVRYKYDIVSDTFGQVDLGVIICDPKSR